VPPHVHRGLLRLYLIVAVPWVAWFGYIAYKANVSLNYEFSQGREFGRLLGILDDADPATPQTPATRYARHELGAMALVWDAKTNDEISEHIVKAIELNDARLTSAIYALLAGAAPALLYPVFLWVLAGFSKPAPITNDARPGQQFGGVSPQRQLDPKPKPIREPNTLPHGPRGSRTDLMAVWLVRAMVVCLFVLYGTALRSAEFQPSILNLIKGFLTGVLVIGLSLLIGRLGPVLNEQSRGRWAATEVSLGTISEAICPIFWSRLMRFRGLRGIRDQPAQGAPA
jgi:hypothetical protein